MRLRALRTAALRDNPRRDLEHALDILECRLLGLRARLTTFVLADRSPLRPPLGELVGIDSDPLGQLDARLPRHRPIVPRWLGGGQRSALARVVAGVLADGGLVGYRPVDKLLVLDGERALPVVLADLGLDI